MDQDKVDAWDEVKEDYQVDPSGVPVPNSMETGNGEADVDEDGTPDDGGAAPG